MYELFEHTADLGLRVIAPDLNALFADAATALFAMIVEDVTAVQPLNEVAFAIEGTDREYLLFDWLRELLMRHDEERILFGKFAVNVTKSGLTATAWGEPIDPARHLLSHEVKAITYHELKIVPHESGWMAEVIVDI
jgi:SHS2 domain-containing protein